MATGIASPDSGSGPAPRKPGGKLAAGKSADRGQLIDRQLRRTRGQVKIVEIAVGLMTLAVAALAFFLVVVLVDHWVLHGGLSSGERFFLFGLLVLGAGYWVAAAILPKAFGRVNPIYAAHTIERNKPSLKNSLINFLLFRQQRETVHEVVYQALEDQAASDIAGAHVESAVDRRRLIHLGYVLVGCLVAFALYFVLSPKDPFTTVERVMLPWTDVPAPARVSIVDIQPGSTTAFRGQPVQVSAEIQGLGSDEQVKLLYTTADHQAVDRAIPLHVPEGYRHTGVMPEGKEGIQQDVEYRIEAGDAVSSIYRVHVIPAPAIVVDSVDYKYPAYTGLEPVTVQHRGDVKAIEGTQVTIHGVANQPIKSAAIDFNCDGKPDQALKVDGQNASITFTLSLNDARTAPLYDSYQLQIVNTQGLENPEPIKHRIEVVPDLPPEVTFLAPQQDEITVPVDGQMVLEVRAIDPDFALSGVRLRAKTERGNVLDQALLPDAPHAGPFNAKYQFAPLKLGLKEGDVVRYLAMAVDNKSPEANETTTPERRIRIVGPENANRRQADPLAQNGASQDQPNSSQPSGDSRNDGRPQNRGQENHSSQNDDQQPPNAQNEKQPQNGNDQQNNRNDGRSGNNDLDRNQQQQDQNNPNGENQQSNPQNMDGQKSGQEKNNDSQPQDKSNTQPPNKDSQQASKDQQQGNKDNQPSNKDNQQSNKGNQQGSQNNQQGNQAGNSRSDQGQKNGSQQNGSQQSSSQQSGDKSQGAQQQSPGTQDGKQSDAQNGQSQPRSQSQSNGQQNDHSPVPSDGSDDGRGLERILERRQQQESQSGEKQNEAAQQSDQNQPQNSQSQKDQPENGQSQNGQSQNGEQQNGQPQNGKAQDGQSQNGQQHNNQSQSGQQPSGQSQDHQSQDHQSQSGQSQDAKTGQQGDKQQNDNQSGNQKSDQQSARDQQSGQSGQQEAKPGDQSSQPADGKANKSGEPSPDQKNQTGQPQSQSDDNAQAKSQDSSNQQSKDGREGEPQDDTSSQSSKDGHPQSKQSQQSPQDNANPSQQSQQNGQQNLQGNSPSGQKDNQQGSAASQQNSQQSEKPSGDSGKPSDSSPSAQSSSNNQHSSNTRGQQDGDRAGNGSQGNGQPSNSQGTGSAGQNTAADQGAGKADQQGQGQSSNQAGGDQKSDRPTGQPGNEKGQGSTSRSANSSNSKSDVNSKSNADSQSNPDSKSNANSQSMPESGSNSNSNSNAGAEPNSNSSSNSKSSGHLPSQGAANGMGGTANGYSGAAPEGPVTKPDDANLDYAKKATSLALNYLKNAMKNGKEGDELLQQLGWSHAEASDFIKRQEQRLQDAQQPDPNDQSRREAEDALRSLGLRPGGTDRSGSTLTSDNQRGLSSGRHTTPPPEYMEQYKAYSQGINSGGK